MHEFCHFLSKFITHSHSGPQHRKYDAPHRLPVGSWIHKSADCRYAHLIAKGNDRQMLFFTPQVQKLLYHVLKLSFCKLFTNAVDAAVCQVSFTVSSIKPLCNFQPERTTCVLVFHRLMATAPLVQSNSVCR